MKDELTSKYVFLLVRLPHKLARNTNKGRVGS